MILSHLSFQPGQHARELNPYWKDGGTGLPEEEKQAKSQNQIRGVGDSGASWIRRAYQRAVQQAQEEGVTLEEIAQRRWGVRVLCINSLTKIS